MSNDIVIEGEVHCAEKDCEAFYKGRLVLDVHFPVFVFGGDNSVTLKGYLRADMPEGWAIRKKTGLLESMFCPVHGVEPKPETPP